MVLRPDVSKPLLLSIMVVCYQLVDSLTVNSCLQLGEVELSWIDRADQRQHLSRVLACALTPTGHGPPLTSVNRVVSWPTMDGFCSIAARVVDSTLVSVVLYGTPLKRASLESSSLECASLECPSLEDCLHVLVLICIVSGLLGPLDLAEYRLMQRLH